MADNKSVSDDGIVETSCKHFNGMVAEEVGSLSVHKKRIPSYQEPAAIVAA